MADLADILRSSWRAILAVGDDFPRIFYEVLFDIAPEAKPLFPEDMREQRKKLMATLGAVVHAADDLDAARPRLRQLGRDHVRYGAGPDHYPVVGAALLFTGQGLVPSWTPKIAEAWHTAYGLVSSVMIDAAKGAAPPVQVPILGHEIVGPYVHVWIPLSASVPPGPDMHASRSDRVGEWLPACHGEAQGDRIYIEVFAPNTPAGWGMANLPPGVDLRLAPVFEETDRA